MKESKMFSSGMFEQRAHENKSSLPLVIANGGNKYFSPKQVSQKAQQSGDRSKDKIQKTHQSPDSRMRGRHMMIQQKIVELRPNTANSKPNPTNHFYSYYLDKGNNSQLVRKIFSRRSWLFEATTLTTVNIRWKQTSKEFNFNQLGADTIGIQRKLSINHLEFHHEISNKNKLYLNMKSYAKKTKENLNDFVPATFLINLDSNTFQNDLKDFIDNFCKIKQENLLKNVWLLKPPDLNRGQGIQLFNDIRVFINQLQEYCKARAPSKQSKYVNTKPALKNVIITYPADRGDPNKDANGMSTVNFILEQNLNNHNQDRIVVLQKYLENPYLYNGRKFDFRVWVLVDHNLNYYFFREGYLRLATDNFEISTASLKNKFIHLTNNAVQKYHERYGKFELGNQLSFSDLQNYFNMKGQKTNMRDKVVGKMKDIVKFTIGCASEKLSQCSRSYQYEIFGYDFMIDNYANIWLIEINTNPCIEESSPLLQKLIPRMLNDAFRLTLDKIFPPSKPEMLDEILSEFAVPGYSNQDNLWELLGRITRP